MLKPAKTSQAPSKVTKAVPDSSKSSQPTPGPSKATKAAPSTTVSSPTTLTVKTTRKSKQIMSEESCNRFLDPTPSSKNPPPRSNNRRQILSAESVNRILFESVSRTSSVASGSELDIGTPKRTFA